MKTGNHSGDNRRIRAQALRRAAKIAELEESPLAVDLWNRACQRIQQLLEAEASKVELSDCEEADLAV
jgi:hypothetical protein